MSDMQDPQLDPIDGGPIAVNDPKICLVVPKSSFIVTGNCLEAVGNFNSTVSWDGTQLALTMTNTSPANNGGYITGIALNLPQDVTLTSCSTTKASFVALLPNGGPYADPPNGSFNYGYAIGGNWLGKGNPKAGIAVGDSVDFSFTFSGATSLTELDMLGLNTATKNDDLDVRFRGFVDGTSDKCLGVTDTIPHSSLDSSISGNVLTNDIPSVDDPVLQVISFDYDNFSNFADIATNPTGTDLIHGNFVEVTTALDGILAVYSDGFWTYSHELSPGLNIEDDFGYTISDSEGRTSSAKQLICASDGIIIMEPILLDLNGDGVSLNLSSSVSFDANDDGIKDQMLGWVNPNDGILVYDPNGTENVINADQISFTSYLPGAKSDLEGLKAFDLNHDGILDSQDSAFNHFGVWIDSNQNGQVDSGEFQTLSQANIQSIALESDNHFQQIKNNHINGESYYALNDGTTHALADAALAYVPSEVAFSMYSENPLSFENLSQLVADVESVAPATISLKGVASDLAHLHASSYGGGHIQGILDAALHANYDNLHKSSAPLSQAAQVAPDHLVVLAMNPIEQMMVQPVVHEFHA